MMAARPQIRRPSPFREVDLLRDSMLFLYIVYPLTGGLQRLLLGNSIGYGGGSMLNQAVTVLMLGVAIICVLYQRVPTRRILLGAGAFVIPTVLVLVSLVWADHLDISMRRAARFCLEVAGILLLVSCYRDTRSFLRTLWGAYAVLVLLDIIAFAVPGSSFTSIGYAGAHGHKNTLGSFCYAAIPILFLGWRLKFMGRWSLLSLGLMAIACGLLLISLSKTAAVLTPFCILLAFIAYRVWQRGLTTQMAVGGMFIALVVMLALPLAGTHVNMAETIGAFTGDPTMTGRTGVWEYTFWRVGDRETTGVGYGSFWDVDISSVALMNQYGVTFAFNQSHNGYIGVYAELGLLGVAAIVIMWLMATSSVLRRVGNKTEWPLVGYGLYISLGYVLYNVTETSFFRVGFDTWVNYVLITAAVAKLVPPARFAPQPAGPKFRSLRGRVYASQSPLPRRSTPSAPARPRPAN